MHLSVAWHLRHPRRYPHILCQIWWYLYVWWTRSCCSSAFVNYGDSLPWSCMILAVCWSACQKVSEFFHWAFCFHINSYNSFRSFMYTPFFNLFIFIHIYIYIIYPYIRVVILFASLCQYCFPLLLSSIPCSCLFHILHNPDQTHSCLFWSSTLSRDCI